MEGLKSIYKGRGRKKIEEWERRRHERGERGESKRGHRGVSAANDTANTLNQTAV